MSRPSFSLRNPSFRFTRMGSKLEKPDYTDALFLGRAVLGLSSLSLLWGYSSVSTFFSFATRLFLHDSAKALSTKSLEKWLLLSLFCTVASALSSFCFLTSSYFSSSGGQVEGEYKFWFVGFVLQKVTGVCMGYFLCNDIGFQETEVEDVTKYLQVRVTVLEGRNLVAKDKNLWGKNVSSDPYVIVFHGPNKLGKTSIVKKSLDPKWYDKKETFILNIIPQALDINKTIECNIFDHDQLSTDDSMGTCFIRIPNSMNTSHTDWYPVENGEGKNYCRNAKGELKVEIEVRSQHRTSFQKDLQKISSEKTDKLPSIEEKQS
ncbi:C2 domain containing protein [Nitzschia inconspicua]|uniref:C2 domain containing protein n=1 Tax=Nitzschia inconspicua TaxID=303405 RepID=A0A9K3KR21_9STRA|nr:C2 domain containing protein [Nitzschia inconspicua]